MAKGMGNLMKQAKRMQEQMLEIQESLAGRTVEAKVGGGMVTVVANGHQEVVSVSIDSEVIDPEDSELLEDLVLAAVNEAQRKSKEMEAAAMEKLTGGIKIPGLM